MRVIPKLISLAADPKVNGQMHNWSFMALHEITGENLPNTASAWQDWYDLHGAEKSADSSKPIGGRSTATNSVRISLR